MMVVPPGRDAVECEILLSAASSTLPTKCRQQGEPIALRFDNFT